MFLEIPAGDSALCHPHQGHRLKEAPSPTSITGDVAKRAVSIRPPALGGTRDASVLVHFPPASHMATFIFSVGQGRTVQPRTQKMELGSSWGKALMPTMDSFLDKYHKERTTLQGDSVGGKERKGEAIRGGAIRADVSEAWEQSCRKSSCSGGRSKCPGAAMRPVGWSNEPGAV